MSALTKEQVQKLTPEQQLELARMEAQHAQARRELANRIRGGRGRGFVVGLLSAVALSLAMYSSTDPRLLPFALFAVIGLVGFHAASIELRLDALMQLLDKDAETKQSATQPAPAPKDGSTASVGNSGVRKGPTSVS